MGVGQTQRSPSPWFGFNTGAKKKEEGSLEYRMELALLKKNCYNEVEELLKLGANPDKMTGQLKWLDTNSLWDITDSRLAGLLISYGADVKKRPYVAHLLNRRIIAAENPRRDWVEYYEKRPDRNPAQEDYIYATCKLLLESGADPNMKVTDDVVLVPANDWNYNRYFKKYGESAINHCIEAGLSKVFSLLVDYGATLDEGSLELVKRTTELTGSSEMEEVVKKIYEEQNPNQNRR